MLNDYDKEAKFACSTGNNQICCPVATNEINKCSKKRKEMKKRLESHEGKLYNLNLKNKTKKKSPIKSALLQLWQPVLMLTKS